MKKIFISISITVILFSCSTKRIALSNVSSERYRYVFDFGSRVAQEKMRALRNNYKAGTAGVFFTDVVASSLNEPYQPDYTTQLPKFFRKIRIKNKGDHTLYANLVTTQMIDQEHSCSVQNIQLPKKASVVLLGVYTQSYTLEWHYPGKENNFYGFVPSGEKVLTVSEQGVNPTTIVY